MNEIEEFNKQRLWEDYVTTLNRYIPIIKSKSEPICGDTFYFVGHSRKEFKVVENEWQYFVLVSVARFLSSNGFLKEENPESMMPTVEELEKILNGNDIHIKDFDITYNLKEFEIENLLKEDLFNKWREHFKQDVEWWMK